jgi:diguanylate cyclase (GGDEF)-like protein/PAS domain S-box-containing protein
MPQQADSDFYLSLLHAYINAANDGIFVVCDEMKFHVANRLMQSWLGESEDRLTAHNARVPITYFLGNEQSQQTFIAQFQKALQGNPVRFDCIMEPPHGESRWVEISMNRVDLEAGDLVIGVVRDITDRKALMDKMHFQARHDELTGLTNRSEFSRQLEQLLAEARSSGGMHALLYLDLDQFKVINDTCGHLAGDELLRRISTLIRTEVRASDALARLGGDEFGILLTDCDLENAVRIAESLREAIARFRFEWDDKPFEIGVSIGITPIGENSESAASILSTADAACYVAKEKGRNRIQVHSEAEEWSRQHGAMHWVSTINQALREGRFQLYFQAIAPLSAVADCGKHREILLRMTDESGSIISAGQFLPAAEKYNLMPTLDRWVIQTLFAGHGQSIRKGWQECKVCNQTCTGFYAINLSGASLNDDRFLDFVREQIRAHDIPPAAICFEITETVAVNCLEQTRHFILNLKALGCRFAMDDFGSGMSSFGYLKHLPIDYLKIDGSLVRGIVESPIDFRMVEAIQRIAEEMQVLTVAEYAESQPIIDALKSLGVDYAQGYAIHKPAPL